MVLPIKSATRSNGCKAAPGKQGDAKRVKRSCIPIWSPPVSSGWRLLKTRRQSPAWRKSLKHTVFPLTVSCLSLADLLKHTYHYLPLLIHTGRAACVQQEVIKYGQELHSSPCPLLTVNSLSTLAHTHTHTRTPCHCKQPPAVCFQLCVHASGNTIMTTSVVFRARAPCAMYKST